VVTHGTIPDRLIPYAGLDLDRAAAHREDPAWVAARATDPRAIVRPMWRDECLVAGDEPVVLPGGVIDDPEQLVLLGLDGEVPHFAVDLSDLTRADALARAGADATVDIRSLFAGLPANEAAMFAFARGLLRWHRHQRYCGRCGSPARPQGAGHCRSCTNTECGQLLFPRIEPAVITLVESARPPARCLLARHRASTTGGYSLLAGFVEVGESLEDAVRREIREEAGIALGRIDYVASQPWPFPAGIMIGFRALTDEESVTVDGNEIIEGRWFTRDELRDYAGTTQPLGRADSIDRIILTDWLEKREQ
jgi:NAD+ diphosphatase